MAPAPDASLSYTLPLQSFQISEINKLSDNQASSLPDDIVCAAAKKSWRSNIYDHFDISLEHRVNDAGERSLWFKFTCKTDPTNHSPQYRARKDTSSGTNNLLRKVLACSARQQSSQLVAPLPPTAHPFSLARFRGLLALWCARNHRPFELVDDELFTALVEELRPGTLLPDPTTISRDVKRIYSHNMEAIRQYFQKTDCIHLAIDGWTAPTSRSYLGLVVIWQMYGQFNRAILEFVKLTHRHKGEYLAQKTAECLNKYDLGRKLLTVCMDNASNNDMFTLHLQKHFPTFGGPSFRARCVAHIVNLMAKAYLDVFSTPVSRKRTSKTQETTQAGHKHLPIDTSHSRAAPVLGEDERGKEREDSGTGDDESDNEAEEMTAHMAADNVDEDKTEYDKSTVKASVEFAFSDIEKRFGVTVSQSDRHTAQQLLPKVAGLASRANKSPLVQQKFEQHVAAFPGLSHSPHPALSRRMATRWNTELGCLRSHVHMRPAVQRLTADRDLSLKNYKLTEPQWNLAEQLVGELKVFERLTLIFSETQVPLIHQVVPALLKLQDRLQATVNNPSPRLHPLLRIAARASLTVFDKYMRLFEESSIYWVALVMCPHYKLEWFRRRGYSTSEIGRVEAMLFSTFEQMTRDWSQNSPKNSQGIESGPSEFDQSLADGWLSDDEIGFDPVSACKDSLEDYLKAPLVPIQSLRQVGLLGYWSGQLEHMPRVARFALGILSSPASSVDAERAFSGGRLTINHLQHSMGDLTFEAKMAVGSWYNTPLLPSVDTAAAIVGEKLRQ